MLRIPGKLEVPRAELLSIERLKVAICNDDLVKLDPFSPVSSTRLSSLAGIIVLWLSGRVESLPSKLFGLGPIIGAAAGWHFFDGRTSFNSRNAPPKGINSMLLFFSPVLPADPSRQPGRDSRAVSLEYLVGPREVEEVVHLPLAPRQLQAQARRPRLRGGGGRGGRGGGRVLAPADVPFSPHADC